MITFQSKIVLDRNCPQVPLSLARISMRGGVRNKQENETDKEDLLNQTQTCRILKSKSRGRTRKLYTCNQNCMHCEFNNVKVPRIDGTLVYFFVKLRRWPCTFMCFVESYQSHYENSAYFPEERLFTEPVSQTCEDSKQTLGQWD